MSKNIITRDLFNQLINQMKNKDELIELENQVKNSYDEVIRLSHSGEFAIYSKDAKNLVNKPIMLKFIQIVKNTKNLDLIETTVSKFSKNSDVKLVLKSNGELDIWDSKEFDDNETNLKAMNAELEELGFSRRLE